MNPVQISTILSIGSIVLGIGAWLLGIFAITVPDAVRSFRNSLCSFSGCILSLLLQLYEVSIRVSIGDYAAIDDTIGAVIMAAQVLIFVTIVLNIFAFVKVKRM